MSSVFISHSSRDDAFVSRLTKDLRAHDFEARSIADVVGVGKPSGTELDRRITEAIRADTYFLPVLTPSAVTSPWIRKELAVALASEADSVKVLPLLGKPCVLPRVIGLRSPVDFTCSYDDGLASLLAVLAPPDPGSAAVNVALKTSTNEPVISRIEEELSKASVALGDLDAAQLEHLVAQVLHEHGYEVRLSHRSNDAGIDLIALSGWDERRVPLYVQCKRYAPNNQLTFEWADSLVASAGSGESFPSMLITTSSCFALDARSAMRKRWRARSRVKLDRQGWAQLFLWLAESYVVDPDVEAGLVEARERYASLTDKRFVSDLDEAEEQELQRLESILDASEMSYYAPIKQRLRAIRDQLRSENVKVS